jgi:glutathione S-transferase
VQEGGTSGEPAAIRVWGVGTARTMRVHWMLHELGLTYETREIIPRTPSMDTPEFASRSRRGKVPILEEGDLVFGESGAIVVHLADTHRDRSVLAPPPATPDRAHFDDVFFFTLTELDAPLYIIRRHQGLADVYGAAPVAVASARDYFLRQTGEIERRLADGRPHVLGDAFSAADLMLTSCFVWAKTLGIALSPSIEEHLARCTDRDAFRSAMKENFTPAAMEMLRQTGSAPSS